MIYSLKSPHDFIDGAAEFVLTRYIDRKCFARSSEGSDMVLRDPALLCIDIKQRYARSFFRESVCDCKTDSGGCARHDCDASFECVRSHASMPPGWRTNTSGS